MTHRPAVVAFDVIETLMSLEPLRERLTEIGQPPHLLEAWYTRTLRDGMALSATGDFAPFTDVAEAALRGLTSYTVSDEHVAHMMAGFNELPAFPDALPAMTTLTDAGIRVACLTNGSAYLTSSFVNRTGLGSLVDRVVTVGEIYRWKRRWLCTCTPRRCWTSRRNGWHWLPRTTGTVTAPSGPG